MAGDNRRLEVVDNGLPLHGGVQLAVDTTLVSSVRGSGEPRQGAATTDGVALTQARRRKEKTYRELTGPGDEAQRNQKMDTKFFFLVELARIMVDFREYAPSTD